jgi:hypothetical protein
MVFDLSRERLARNYRTFSLIRTVFSVHCRDILMALISGTAAMWSETVTFSTNEWNRGRRLADRPDIRRKGPMRAKRTTTEQVELILRLYELRRETVMREARSFVGGPFLPKSDDELVSMVTKGGKETGFVLQVYGYWI